MDSPARFVSAARPLAGTEDADYPFWSPDSRFLGFFAQGQLKKVEVSGGAVLTICDAAGNGRGGTWNRDGLIVFGSGNRSPLSKVPASGGTPTAVTALGDGERSHRWPQVPAGRPALSLLELEGLRQEDQSSVLVAPLDGPAPSSQHQHLVRAGSMPLYADGLLLFLREDATLVAQSFDIGGGILSGEAVPLGANIARRSGQSRACGILRFEQWGLGLFIGGRRPKPAGMAGPWRPFIVHTGRSGPLAQRSSFPRWNARHGGSQRTHRATVTCGCMTSPETAAPDSPLTPLALFCPSGLRTRGESFSSP